MPMRQSTTKTTRRTMGRPKADLNLDIISKLASCGCTVEEIAATMGVNPDTLYARQDAMQALNLGRSKGRASLRSKQFEKAYAGDTTMLIWLGKQLLNQKDRHEFSHISDEELIERTKMAFGGVPTEGN